MNRWSSSAAAATTLAQTTAKAIRRSLFWLLLGSYLLGAFLPGPGEAMRNWDLSNLGFDLPGGIPARFSLWMVAVLLFCGAASTDLSKLMDFVRRPAEMVLALLGVWLPPLLLVLFWGLLLNRFLLGQEDANATGLLLGLALTAAMPVANSAVGWTHQSSGNLAWSIGLVLFSISLCPWVAPQLLGFMGHTLSSTDAVEADALVSQFTGAVFLCWVIVPTLCGFAWRALRGAKRSDAGSHWLTIATAVALLLLNYANASMALPRVSEGLSGRLLLITVVAAASLPIVGLLTGWLTARSVRLPSAARTAWGYSLGMKNTGLALSLADTALGGQPVAVLVILTVTLMQHAVASVAHMSLRWHDRKHATDLEQG